MSFNEYKHYKSLVLYNVYKAKVTKRPWSSGHQLLVWRSLGEAAVLMAMYNEVNDVAWDATLDHKGTSWYFNCCNPIFKLVARWSGIARYSEWFYDYS